MAPGTPTIAVENATLDNERRTLGTLGGIADAVAAAGLSGPTLVLIGAVVAMADLSSELPAGLAIKIDGTAMEIDGAARELDEENLAA